ncbi:phosphatase PAP2 family protein [Magnetovibrio blakemorei]|nr:phosphatase PAP2 family protein [Magnetovibrio blakemorei]
MAGFRIFGETTYHALHVRPFRTAGLWKGIRQSEIFSLDRAAAAYIPVLLLPLFSSVFTSFKISIPEIVPFAWDQTLMRADLALHGGVHPWQLLQPVLGHPLVTSALSYLYNFWHGMICVVYWQMFRLEKRALRMQFLISFVLTWAILGSLGALLFSSAGPCYYGYIVDGPNPFAEQLAYLQSTQDIFTNRALLGQEYLWRLYQDGKAGLGGGISAMPSLHVAVALLIFLLARSFSRRMAWITGTYVVIIMVGSVHLGWHYAVDGYVALIGAAMAWMAAGWIVRNVVPPAPCPSNASSDLLQDGQSPGA